MYLVRTLPCVAGFRQQLVQVLGQATADEVIALRGQTAEPPAAEPVAAKADTADWQPPSNSVTEAGSSQAAQDAAMELHEQAAATISDSSELPQTAASEPPSAEDVAVSDQGPLDEAARAAQTDLTGASADSGSVERTAAGDLTGVDSETQGSGAQAAAAGASTPSQAPAANRTELDRVTVVLSNPRFGTKSVKQEADAKQPAVKSEETLAAVEGDSVWTALHIMSCYGFPQYALAWRLSLHRPWHART